MSELLLQVLCEGHTDHALLEKMRIAGLLPPNLKLGKPDRDHAGKDRLGPVGAAMLLAGKDVVLVHDRDGQEPRTIAARLCEVIRTEVTELGEPERATDRDDVFHAGMGGRARVAVVVVGLGDIDGLAGVEGIGAGAIDDYVLRMALDAATWNARKELRNACSHATFTKKVFEVAQLLRQNGLTVDSTKQLLPTIRLVTSFGAAPATQTSDLWDSAVAAHGAAVTRFAEPLAGAIHAAVRALRG